MGWRHVVALLAFSVCADAESECQAHHDSQADDESSLASLRLRTVRAHRQSETGSQLHEAHAQKGYCSTFTGKSCSLDSLCRNLFGSGAQCDGGSCKCKEGYCLNADRSTCEAKDPSGSRPSWQSNSDRSSTTSKLSWQSSYDRSSTTSKPSWQSSYDRSSTSSRPSWAASSAREASTTRPSWLPSTSKCSRASSKSCDADISCRVAFGSGSQCFGASCWCKEGYCLDSAGTRCVLSETTSRRPVSSTTFGVRSDLTKPFGPSSGGNSLGAGGGYQRPTYPGQSVNRDPFAYPGQSANRDPFASAGAAGWDASWGPPPPAGAGAYWDPSWGPPPPAGTGAYWDPSWGPPPPPGAAWDPWDPFWGMGWASAAAAGA